MVEYICITVLSLPEIFLYVIITYTITCVLYVELFTSAGGCYLGSKALLNVPNECEILNDGLPAAF